MKLDWIEAALNEVARARNKFPNPDLLTTAFAEEAGELVKAILDNYHGKPSNVYEEAIQVIAMVVRLIEEGDPVHKLEPEELFVISGDLGIVSYDPTLMTRFRYRGYSIMELNHIISEHEHRLHLTFPRMERDADR